jgi:hypothetical protein
MCFRNCLLIGYLNSKPTSETTNASTGPLVMKSTTPFLKYREFECRGKGLTFSSQPRATPVEMICALAGKHRPTTDGPSSSEDTYSNTWWEAQVRLYGLECSDWTEDGMARVLMDAITASFQPPSDLLAVEKQLNHDYEFMDWDKQYRPEGSSDNTRIETSEIQDHQSVDIDLSRNAAENNDDEAILERPSKIATKAGGRGGWTSYPVRNPEKRLERISRLHKEYLTSDAVDDTLFGEWQFDFPDITHCPREDIVWNIHPPVESESCLWVVIDQVDLEGIVEIPWRTSEGWKGKRIPFSFRGGETGSGYHSSGGGNITFTSTHECSGTFESEWDDPWAFIGKKVSNELPDRDREECRVAYNRSYNHRKDYWRW